MNTVTSLVMNVHYLYPYCCPCHYQPPLPDPTNTADPIWPVFSLLKIWQGLSSATKANSNFWMSHKCPSQSWLSLKPHPWIWSSVLYVPGFLRANWKSPYSPSLPDQLLQFFLKIVSKIFSCFPISISSASLVVELLNFTMFWWGTCFPVIKNTYPRS